MATNLDICLGLVAPYYNLVLVIIVVLLFIKLFKTPNKNIFILPWKFLFAAIFVYIIEETITIVEGHAIISPPAYLFPLLETVIVTLFVYMCLIQKEHIKKTEKTVVKKKK